MVRAQELQRICGNCQDVYVPDGPFGVGEQMICGNPDSTRQTQMITAEDNLKPCELHVFHEDFALEKPGSDKARRQRHV